MILPRFEFQVSHKWLFFDLKDWQVPKGKDCKMKCRIRLEKESLVNDDKVIQDFLSRKFLRFNICILKEPNKAEGKSKGDQSGNAGRHSSSLAARSSRSRDGGQPGEVKKFDTNYVIDLQLVKGTPMVFLDFCQNFFSMIETRI